MFHLGVNLYEVSHYGGLDQTGIIKSRCNYMLVEAD